MATFTQGPLGGFSGKIGHVVGTQWRGKNVMRSLPTEGKKTYTAAQLLQQERMKVTQTFLKGIQFLLAETFGSKTEKNPPNNNAMSYHMKEALIPTATGFEIDYTKVLIGLGPLGTIEQPILQRTDPDTLTLQWTDNSNQGYAYPDDGLIVVAYAPEINYFESYTGAYQRHDSTCELIIPKAFEGLEIVLWATFYNTDKQLAATSKYLGVVLV